VLTATTDPFDTWGGDDEGSVDESDAPGEMGGGAEVGGGAGGEGTGVSFEDGGIGAAADTPSRRTYQRRLMTPLVGVEDDRQTWLLVGPVSNASDVNPQEFAFTAHIVAHSRYSAREVFARSIPRLVNAKDVPFGTEASTFESLRFLARSVPLADEVGADEPSWRDFPVGVEHLSPVDCKRVLTRAKTAAGRAADRADDGAVTLVSVRGALSARGHPWFKYNLELHNTRVSRRAAGKTVNAAGFMRLSVVVRRAMVAGAPARVIADLRKFSELVHLSTDDDSDEDAPKRRATRRSMPYGKTAPRMLPTADQVRTVIREAVDQPGAIPHSMLTLDPTGAVRVWRYVVGSATTGTRWYELGDGSRKRLAAPYHRRRVPGERSAGSRSRGGRRARRRGELVELSDAVDAVADESISGRRACTAAELRARFYITRSTYLESLPPDGAGSPPSAGPDTASDNGGRELVVAVEFDPEVAVRSALASASGAKVASEKESQLAPVALTLAGDGGPVRRTSMTVFTLTVSTTLLRKGRTPLIPFLFILGGEQAIHSSVGERLRRLLRRTMLATYEVPVKIADPSEEPSPTSSPGPQQLGARDQPNLVPFGPGDVTHTNDNFDGIAPVQGADLGTNSGVNAGLGSNASAAPATSAPCALAPDGTPRDVRASTTPAPAPSVKKWRVRSVPLRLPFVVRLCGDFAMLCHFLTLTGGGDVNRCPFRWPCWPAGYLSSTLLDGGTGDVRDGQLLSAHLDLTIWSLARWSTLRDGTWRVADGRLLWACGSCRQDMVAVSASAAVLSCSNVACYLFERPQATLLPKIAYTPLSTAFRRLRRRLGGPRGYPLLGDIPFVIQAPVMHCAGKISKSLMYFLLALLHKPYLATARQKIYALLGRSNLGAMYLREFARLDAMIVALPDSLGCATDAGVDAGVIVMMQLNQLMSASWRRAIGSQPAVAREHAAATMQLAAALLATTFRALKPFDPETKKAGVLNLYLHTALTHVRQSVGADVPTLQLICDDHIEGMIASLNRYFNRRTNNVSRGQSLVNRVALVPLTFDKTKTRRAAEQQLFTKEILVCPCIIKLSSTAGADLEAAVRLACRDAALSVAVDSEVETLSLTPETATLVDAARETTAAAAAASAGAAAVAGGRAAVNETMVAPGVALDPASLASQHSTMHEAEGEATVASAAAQAAMVAVAGLVPLLFSLAADVDAIRTNKTPELQPSMEQTLQAELEQVQRRIYVCMCGNLSGKAPSAVARKAMASTADWGTDSELDDADAEHAGAAPSTTAASAVEEGDALAAPRRAVESAGAERLPDSTDEAAEVAPGVYRAEALDIETGVAADEDVGEDMLLPERSRPRGDVPVEGDRCYRLEELGAAESDDEGSDMGSAHGDDGHCCARTCPRRASPGEDGFGAFLLEGAVGDDTLSPFLPSAAVVQTVLGSTAFTSDSPDAVSIARALEEELILVQLFIARLRTPEFPAWARRDGVLLRDMALAAEHLRHAIVCKMADL